MTNENKIERALNILLDMQHAIAPEGVDAQYEVIRGLFHVSGVPE
jgi:hypothetical protein